MLKFFLNSNNTAYLRSLEEEFNESTNGIRLELNKLEQAGLLNAALEGNKKVFSVNKTHTLFQDLTNMVRKYVGIDKIIEVIAEKLGELKFVYLVGDLSRGLQSDVIELVLVGKIDEEYLARLVKKAELEINKRVECEILDDISPEFLLSIQRNNYLLLYSK
ncbi:MAG: ArsR family transcriptional regulator [Luteibaculaceae bacterium]